MLEQYREAVEARLRTILPEEEMPPLRAAMRYSLLAGGKRLRPCMLLAAVAMMGEDWRGALEYACALEMIHTYSLIHDDLPAMDNDTLRRGKPTNHVIFGEGQAVLAGDGLLNCAYERMLAAALAHPHSLERPRWPRSRGARAWNTWCAGNRWIWLAKARKTWKRKRFGKSIRARLVACSWARCAGRAGSAARTRRPWMP